MRCDLLKRVLITGATGGIGREITKELLNLGYQLYAIGRDFNKLKIEHRNLKKIVCDLSKREEIEKLKSIKNISILIHCAGVGYFGVYENLTISEIEEMVAINLTAPLILTNLFLSSLKRNRGVIININSISAIKPAIFGAVYGATKAGLKHFGNSLFYEARKSGLKVVNINPDITKTEWFNNLNFSYSKEEESYINPKQIATIIKEVLSKESNIVITDIRIEPQIFKIQKKR